jgi:hypothetical protein
MESLQKYGKEEKSLSRIQHNSDLVSLPIHVEAIARIVYEVNQLRQYPLNDIEIAEWATTLNEFNPDMEIEALQFIIQQMKFGNLEYEQKDGVQNLTRAFQRIRKTADGWQIRKTNVW